MRSPGFDPDSESSASMSNAAADDYPVEACTIINDEAGTASNFVSGQSCASVFPSSTILADVYIQKALITRMTHRHA